MDTDFITDDSKFEALVERDPNAEGKFVYCVTSTMICCRPTCSSRPPLKKNVCYYETIEEAMINGYIPCKRCKPELLYGWNQTRDTISKACKMIMRLAKMKRKPDIDLIASELNVSKWHLCRTFKNYTEMTPRQFYLKCIDGQDPLAQNPLPLIQTKKHLQKLKMKKAILEKGGQIQVDSSASSSPKSVGDDFGDLFSDLGRQTEVEDYYAFGEGFFDNILDISYEKEELKSSLFL